METLSYPIACRTALATLQLDFECSRVSEQDYEVECAAVIAGARLALHLDTTWQDTGPDGTTPIGVQDNPAGMSMVFYRIAG